MALLWFTRGREDLCVFDDCLLDILSKIRRARMSGNLDFKPAALCRIYLFMAIFIPNGWPEGLICPFVEIVENVSIGSISITSSSDTLGTSLLEEVVGQLGYPLECGLPISYIIVSAQSDSFKHMLYLRWPQPNTVYFVPPSSLPFRSCSHSIKWAALSGGAPS